MWLQVEVEPPQFRRVPVEATSAGRPAGKVHTVVTVDGIMRSGHDLAQKTAEGKEWPWGKPTEAVSNEEWLKNPCELCLAAANGEALPGYV